MSKKYLGDKYIKAYKFFRDKQEESIQKLQTRVYDLEKMVEFLCQHIMEDDFQ